MFGRGWHGGGPRSRMFERGALKYLILDLLAERPRHGYDVIGALEDRCGGFYAPSPGSIYPILQMLEDMGHTAVETRDGRKTYTLTDAGRESLAANRDHVDAIWSRLGGHHAGSDGERGPRGPGPDWHPHWDEMRDDLKDLLALFGRKALARHLDADKLARLRDVIVRARNEIEEILRS